MRTVEKAKYFYIAGFFLTVSPDTVQLVAEHAAANRKVHHETAISIVLSIRLLNK